VPVPAGVYGRAVTPQVVYLHGFASSAQSSKAQFFTERFAAVGVAVHTPDLNEPDFETLTVTRMIARVEAEIRTRGGGPVILMGSSMGAFVAWHAAARLDAQRAASAPSPVSHLVLLAPAVTFGRDRDADFGPGVVDAWQRAGSHEFFHYAYGVPRRLHYGFYEDAVAHQRARAQPSAPTLVFQGTRDEVVDAAGVQAFFADVPQARLRLLDDGHQLLAHLDMMWEETRAFVGV